ncbi:MAG: TMEM14 family protein [Fimbriimonadaceae bacterium]|nr:TMEM14 family protein [Fimbriimonadaceae bacterium]
MQTSAVITLVYGVLLVVGGVFGGLKAGSQASLIAGCLSGVVAFLAAGLQSGGRQAGVFVALGLAVALAAWSGKSVFLDGAKFMPRGMVLVLSLGQLVALLPQLRGRG